ncbi:MAG: peptide chain release factor N(5)-glutamine methyltransferase [Saprospiraceae bacterium]|nr:peptide chain release factor N(5)-glutamine methyltransferase [Saprospiraceae bacterium]
MTSTQARHQLAQQLQARYDEGEARSIARIVLEELLQLRIVPGDAMLSDHQKTVLATWTERLLEGEPVQYVVGNTHFYGLVFATDARALIPRPETEELVHWVLETHPVGSKRTVLDIGTGSGCIAVTLKKKRPDWALSAVDASEVALQLARENARRLQCAVQFIQQDILDEALWAALGRFDIILSNPPYIPVAERALMPEQVLRFEPEAALFVSDEDPLRFYRAIAQFARQALLPGGQLFYEINEFRAEEVAALLRDGGFEEIVLREDMQGKLRMCRAGRTR